jgi:broad specificity phosphatase PhoE
VRWRLPFSAQKKDGFNMTVSRILFIRPGETDWNRAGKQQGTVAAPLNALGKRQAEKLAVFLRVIGVSALYSSTTRRAAQTAEIVVEKLGYAPIMDERLRERSVGEWQGLTLGEIRDWYPASYAALLTEGDSYRIPGGDSRQDVRERMNAALADILKQGKGETVAIISHTTAIKMALLVLMPGTDVEMADLTNTSVTTVVRDEASGVWRIVALDDVLHLEGMEANAVIEPEDRS